MKTESILNRILFAGVACAALCLPSVGQAGKLGTSVPIFGDPVTISYLGANTATAAGVFGGATFNGVPIPDFWCIDITHHVPYPPWTLNDYTQATFQSAPLSFSATQVSNLETLFFNDYNGSLFTSADNAAAFQLAIWDVLFDSDGNLSTYGNPPSTFGVVSGASGALALAQSWITAAENPAHQHNFSLVQLTSSAGNQAFVYPNPRGQEAPEPTGVALLGAGLVAMLLATRRRRTDLA